MKKSFLYIAVFLVALSLAACGGNTPAVELPQTDVGPAPAEAQAEDASAEPESAEEPPAAKPEPTAIPEPDFEPQSAEGQRIEFKATDGIDLVGYYYPASIPDAPIILLMHWAGGDQTDWQKNGMIDWLQNRSGNTSGMQSPTHQSVIYTLMPKGVSFAVFSFDFRGFGESSGAFSQEKGLFDAQGAYERASTLEGIDPNRIAGIGSSIGADGVVDACADGCLGALSLSPGSYLTHSYEDEIQRLNDEKKIVTCVASEGDSYSLDTCEGASGENYQIFIYAGDAHGDQLYQNPPEGFTQMIFDWLITVFEITS